MATVEQIIGLNIRNARETQGWSQANLGEFLGAVLGRPTLPPQTIYTMEKGDRAFVATELVGLAAVLKTSAAALLQPAPGIEVIEVGRLSMDRSTFRERISGTDSRPVADVEEEAIAGLLNTSTLNAQEAARLLARVEHATRVAARYFEDEGRRAAEEVAADYDANVGND